MTSQAIDGFAPVLRRPAIAPAGAGRRTLEIVELPRAGLSREAARALLRVEVE